MTPKPPQLDAKNLSGDQLQTLKALIQSYVDLGRILREGATRVDTPGTPNSPQRATAGALRTIASDAELLSVRLAELVVQSDTEYKGESESYSGLLHRTWLDVRSMVNFSDPYVVLLEVEKAHQRARDSLGEQTLTHASDPLGAVLLGLYGEANASHDRITSLRVASREPLAS